MRLIDADALNILKYTRWFENVEDARQVERMIREAPTIAPPPNPPMTMEELREMDGEPVWVEMFTKELKSHWAIVYGKYLSDGRFTDDKERCLISIDVDGGYGLAYLVYRRKPEENS